MYYSFKFSYIQKIYHNRFHGIFLVHNTLTAGNQLIIVWAKDIKYHPLAKPKSNHDKSL